MGYGNVGYHDERCGSLWIIRIPHGEHERAKFGAVVGLFLLRVVNLLHLLAVDIDAYGGCTAICCIGVEHDVMLHHQRGDG